VGEEPEEEREADAQDKAGDDWEVKSSVFSAMNDVAGQMAETKREFSAGAQKSADKGKECADDEESPAEFAERSHED
jgi:hypothetical protein